MFAYIQGFFVQRFCFWIDRRLFSYFRFFMTPLISVPKNLRTKLGHEAADDLVTLLRDVQDESRGEAFQLLEDRFERRILESEGRVRQEMHGGFRQIQEQFLRMQQQFTDVHRQISSQTRWLVVLLMAATVLLPVAQKILDTYWP